MCGFPNFSGFFKAKIAGDSISDFEQKLDLQYISDFQSDKNGHFWLVSDGGLVFFNPKTSHSRIFSAASGFEGHNFSYLTQTKSGEIWLTNSNNIMVFDPENAVKKIETKPKIQFTSVKIADSVVVKDYEIDPFLTVPSGKKLELNFVALDFADAPNNRIFFRMDKLDADSVWSERKNTEGIATYFQLPAGTYTFQVRAENSDGVSSEKYKTLTIKVLSPWFFSWFGIFFWITLLASVIWGIVKVRESRLRAKAAFERKILTTELAALRAQMNPHFLFNTMNSINAVVLRKESDNASRFLTDFAHLMRQILDSSSQEFIALEKEVEILRGYLKMEQLRFDNRFTFEINIDDGLDVWDTQVPSLFFQPFIENAILHGLNHKIDGLGVLKIDFSIENAHYFTCTIADNGVGRKRSAEINAERREKSHDSKGMNITNNRVEILNANRVEKINIAVVDLKNTEGVGIGTSVVIRLPFF
ncbi:MAG: histidine kinase [Saprospiraceae bacterium]|nr:histidine kinase [Saprospiraceae bacterium]